MNKNSNIFTIFHYQASPNEKKFILSLCLLFAFCSSSYIGIPIWFEEPKLSCYDSQTDSYYQCTEVEMCSKNLIYKIDTISPISLVSELNLLCEKKLVKRLLLTMMYFGGFIGSVVNFLIYIKPDSRKTVLGYLGFLFALSNFSIIIFISSEFIVGISLAMISFSSIIANAYGFIIINEFFSGDLAKTATILMRLFWGVFGIFFGGFCYMIHSNWKILFFTMGILVLLNSFYLLFFHSEMQIKETLSKAPKNVLEFFKQISNIKQIRNNFIIYVIIWTASSITYNAIFLELETIGGNFYINMMLISTIEILASFASSVISLKFNINTFLKFSMRALIFLFAIFFFAPTLHSENNIFTTFALIFTLLGKFFSEIVTNLTYIAAPKVLTDKFTPAYMISVRLFSRVCLLFLPHINYFFILCHLHAFVFVAIVWSLASFLHIFTKEVQPEGIEEILNEFKIDLVSRISILTVSSVVSHHPPDEFLRNFEINDDNLMEIKRSRILKMETLHQSLIALEKQQIVRKCSKDDMNLNFG